MPTNYNKEHAILIRTIVITVSSEKYGIISRISSLKSDLTYLQHFGTI